MSTFADYPAIVPYLVVNGTTSAFVLMVPNADEAFTRAVAAGARSLVPPADQFYGYRMGSLMDPSGHKWLLQQRIQAVSVEEMQASWEKMACRPLSSKQ